MRICSGNPPGRRIASSQPLSTLSSRSAAPAFGITGRKTDSSPSSRFALREATGRKSLRPGGQLQLGGGGDARGDLLAAVGRDVDRADLLGLLDGLGGPRRRSSRSPPSLPAGAGSSAPSRTAGSRRLGAAAPHSRRKCREARDRLVGLRAGARTRGWTCPCRGSREVRPGPSGGPPGAGRRGRR